MPPRTAQRYEDQSYELAGSDSLTKILEDLPQLSASEIGTLRIDCRGVRRIPDELLKGIRDHGQGLKILTVGKRYNTNVCPVLSDQGLKYISEINGLDTLQLACSFSGEGFRHIAQMRYMQALSLSYPTINAREFFLTAAKLSNLRSASVIHGDFSDPIDKETFNAITSLNGRLESLSFGEWQETGVHSSMIPAITQIKSLTWLELGNTDGTLPEEMLESLQSLPYLRHLNPSYDIVAAMNRFSSRETYPVEFRPVESESGMMALLNYLFTEIEAKKVRREVIKRQLGRSEMTEDFTNSSLPLGHIFSRIFGVKFQAGAGRDISFIDHKCPELEAKIRRYLSGMDIGAR